MHIYTPIYYIYYTYVLVEIKKKDKIRERMS